MLLFQDCWQVRFASNVFHDYGLLKDLLLVCDVFGLVRSLMKTVKQHLIISFILSLSVKYPILCDESFALLVS